MGYAEPTPVQRDAIPLVLSGSDLMVQAATGTGKTAAFALPMLHRLLDRPRGQIRGLVLSPTRELAEQTQKHLIQLGRRTRLRSLSLYGGVSIYGQSARLKAGIEIVAACPGRLLDHMRQGTVRLDQLEMLVIDEADSMFQMGFIDDVRSIMKHVPATCQRLLFSATLPPAVKELAGDALREPLTLTVDRQAPAATVDHSLYPVPATLKVRLLTHILNQGSEDCMVVFARTRHGASRLAQHLETLGFRTACLQGQLSQRQRNAALSAFRRRELQVLVATDVASRGIDVSGVSHVINYDIPATAETYIHRAGRTGRAETSGVAITFVTPGDEGLVRQIERSLGQKLARRKLQDFDYGNREKGPDKAKAPGLKPPVPGKAKRVHERVETRLEKAGAVPRPLQGATPEPRPRRPEKERAHDREDAFRPLRRDRRPFWERDSRFPERNDSGARYFTRNEIFSADSPDLPGKRGQKPHHPPRPDNGPRNAPKNGFARRSEQGRVKIERPPFERPAFEKNGNREGFPGRKNGPKPLNPRTEETKYPRGPREREAFDADSGGMRKKRFPKNAMEKRPRKAPGALGRGNAPLRKKQNSNSAPHKREDDFE